jgi:hypothetical protein
MIRRLLPILFTPLVILSGFALPGPQMPDVEGQPTQLRQGALESYWFWHDEDGYHLRTTTQHDKHVFTGRIEFSRGEAWVKAYQLKPDDVVRLIGQRLEFHLATQRDLSGFDFRLEFGNSATVFLEIDGHKGVLDHVFVGRENAHPATDPFTVSP